MCRVVRLSSNCASCRAVENLDARCRKETSALKHYENLNKVEDHKALVAKALAEKDMDPRVLDLEHRKQQALDRLLIVGDYIVDFADMVAEHDAFRKEQAKAAKALAKTQALSVRASTAKDGSGSVSTSMTVGSSGMVAVSMMDDHSVQSSSRK
jgi:hypothetical protein